MPGKRRRKPTPLDDGEYFVLEMRVDGKHHRDVESSDFEDGVFYGCDYFVNSDGSMCFNDFDLVKRAANILLRDFYSAGLDIPQLYFRIIQGDEVVDSLPLDLN